LFKNLELAYGDQLDERARKALGSKVYEHLGQLGIEIVLLRARGLRYFADRIDFEVRHPVLEGDRSQLPIIVTAHLGNWELGAAALAARGMPLLGVAYDLDDGGIGDAVQAFRRDAAVPTVSEHNAVKMLLRGYAQGRAPAMLMDVRSYGNPVMVPFFGHDAPTSPGPALIALRTGAPILPMFCARTHGGTRYRAFAGEPIIVDRSRPFRSEVLRITAAISLAIEQAVRAYPDQWYWCYRRWRGRGKDETGGARAWRSARSDAQDAGADVRAGAHVSDLATDEMQAPGS
jgi:KDO2-lipid IV(A) lauroyltransferase